MAINPLEVDDMNHGIAHIFEAPLRPAAYGVDAGPRWIHGAGATA
ncbi:hypothetical protein AB0I22_15370 [Streptomyces sp. NPDC050610]